MGLLSAGIFQGLGAGVSAFGGQMMRGVEKEQDEAMLQQRARVLAEIQRESAKLNRQDALEFDTNPSNIDLRNAADKKRATAAGETAREVEAARAADPVLNKALRDKAVDDQDALHTAATRQAIADANNPEFLAAQKKIALNDPRVAAQIEASRASAAASYANAKESGQRGGLISEQLAGVKLTNANLKRLDGLYDQQIQLLGDKTIPDDVRAERLKETATAIALIKSKTAPSAARDPELDTQTITEERQNEDGSTTKTTRKEVRRPGASGGKPNMTEEQAHAEASAAIARGAPADAVNARLQGMGFKPVGAAGAKPTPAKPGAPAASVAPPVDSRPAPDAMAQTVVAELAPVVEQYKAAQAQLAAAAKSGDATALARYSQAVQALRDNITRQANERLGNGAQRYLSSMGV